MLEGALSLIGAAFCLVAFCSAGYGFYLQVKRMGHDGAERKLWDRRYYKAMLMFLAGWCMAALIAGVKYLLGFPVSSTIGQ